MSDRPQPRDSVALMTGYHSPQLAVDVRLNTNECPVSPPEAFRQQVAAAVASIDWHRYPERDAIGLRKRIGALHGVGPEQIFAANGSNEVLQTSRTSSRQTYKRQLYETSSGILYLIFGSGSLHSSLEESV